MGSQVVPFGRTKLILAFRNFAKTPKNPLAADPEVACNNRIPAFHSSGNSHCAAVILCGRSCRSFVALFDEVLTPFLNT
jgi:hypothetical protein